jgi:type I restriction enzyme S subunit
MEENQVHIPDGWKLNKLGAVCRIKKGVQFNRVELTDSGMYPCINGGIEPSGYSDLWNTNENTITISEGGNSCGFINLIKTKFWSGGHCYSLLDLKSDIENDFLYQALKGRQNLIMDLRVGSGLPNIQQKAIKEFEFLSPENPSEQTQIATILSKVDEAIAQTEQLIAKYTRIKTGLMQDLLTKGIDEHGNIRSEETHAFKDSPLGRIPKEWEVVDITKFTKNYDNAVKPGPFGSSVKKEFYTDTGYKIYGQEQVIANNPFIGDYFIDEKRYKSLFGFRVASGDVLLSCVGTIGSVLIIPEDFEEGIINPRLIKFSLDSDKTNIYFFAEYLKHSSINTQLINLATGGTMPVLNKKIVLSLQFIYPQIDEQNRINEKWKSISNHIQNEELNLSKLQSLKTGLMQDLLSGKVRVNHLIKETASV